MKKVFLFSVLFSAILSMMMLVSCNKENETTIETTQEKNNIVNTEDVKASSRAPMILATSIQNFTACGNWNSCNIPSVVGTTKTNGVKITLEPLTHSFFNNMTNTNGEPITYRFFEKNAFTTSKLVPYIVNPSKAYLTSIQTFERKCNQSVVYFADTGFKDNTDYYLVITSGNSTSPVYQFKALANITGKPCGGTPNPIPQASSVTSWWNCGYYTTGINTINTAPPYNIRMNGLNIQLENLTHSIFNSNGQALTYKVYKVPRSSNPSPIDNFSTNFQNVRRSGWIYGNNTNYEVIIQNSNGTILSQSYFFKTGNFKGKPC